MLCISDHPEGLVYDSNIVWVRLAIFSPKLIKSRLVNLEKMPYQFLVIRVMTSCSFKVFTRFVSGGGGSNADSREAGNIAIYTLQYD